MLGVIAGALAVTGLVAGIGAIGAGAQNDDPSTSPLAATLESVDDDQAGSEEGEAAQGEEFDHAEHEAWIAFDECMAEQLGDIWLEPFEGEFHETGEFEEGEFPGHFDFEEGELPEDFVFEEGEFHEGDFEGTFFEPSGEEIAAIEAAEATCGELLPEDIRAEMAAWEAFGTCIDNELGITPGTEFSTEPEFDEAAWSAAEEACLDTLPDDIRAEMEAFAAFDECLGDSGVSEIGPAVHVDGPDGLTLVEFGAGEGSVTVSGSTAGLSVSTTGDVSVLGEEDLDARWEAHDAAFESCEQLLPAEG